MIFNIWYIHILYIYIHICIHISIVANVILVARRQTCPTMFFEANYCIQTRHIWHLSSFPINLTTLIYCWWKKSCTSWYGKYSIIYKGSCMLGGCLGFLSSTVSLPNLPAFIGIPRTGESHTVNGTVRHKSKWALMDSFKPYPKRRSIRQSVFVCCWNFEAVGIPNMTFGGFIYTKCIKCIPLFWFPLQNGWARALHFRMILGEGDQHIGKGYSGTSPPLLVWSCWPCNSKNVTWL